MAHPRIQNRAASEPALKTTETPTSGAGEDEVAMALSHAATLASRHAELDSAATTVAATFGDTPSDTPESSSKRRGSILDTEKNLDEHCRAQEICPETRLGVRPRDRLLGSFGTVSTHPACATVRLEHCHNGGRL